MDAFPAVERLTSAFPAVLEKTLANEPSMTLWFHLFHLRPVVAEDAGLSALPRAVGQGRQGDSSGKLDCRNCRTSAGGPGKDRFST